MVNVELGEQAPDLNQQFQHAKAFILRRDITAPGPKHDKWKALKRELDGLRDKGVEKLQIEVDLSLITDDNAKTYSIAHAERTLQEEKEIYGVEQLDEFPAAAKESLLTHNFWVQMQFLRGESEDSKFSIVIPSPDIVIPPHVSDITRPSAAENFWASRESHESIDLKLECGWNYYMFAISPHQGNPFLEPLIPYRIPLDLVTSIREASPDAPITPSISKRTLLPYTE